ncbi:hypothetical protein EV188_102401 [Actinomycetospora succinea]|uniref:Uncharacterized protein n=1 Tax=Actinomycetospora succinea TaxID=663603 RepID=A0A4R6VIV4_9PSEU|nr:hypothetical protein [Actinomycetospora succinea]TDQ62746.1 hypothetical protein EV188_102401 [Actinomycetospora succinea]
MTRARGPAGHEPDGTGGMRAPGARPAGPPADDAETAALPVVPPAGLAGPVDAGRPSPAVPEVPAIADIAAPGRPDVDAVVAPEAPAARRRPRPSRHMRARADEMARMLSRAAPAGARRRGLSSVPAAAAVMAAVAVGGVGIALGLDAQRTGAEIALPGVPNVPADQTPVPETPEHTLPTVDTGVVEALDPDEGRAPEPSSVAASARRAPAPAAPPRATTPTSRHRPTSTTARSTTPDRSTTTTSRTPRSTTPSPTPRADAGTNGGAPEGAAVGSRGLGDLDSDAPDPSSSSSPLDGGTTTAE